MKHEGNRYPIEGFCERLKDARHNAGLSQRELSEKVNISRESVKAYEGGWQIPTFTIVVKMAATLKVSLDYLAFGRDK